MTCEFGKFSRKSLFYVKIAAKNFSQKFCIRENFRKNRKSLVTYVKIKQNLGDFSQIFREKKFFRKIQKFANMKKKHFRFNPISTLK